MPSGGEAGQVWTSNGIGQGNWQDIIPTEDYQTLVDTSALTKNVSVSIESIYCPYTFGDEYYAMSLSNGSSSEGIYFDKNNNIFKKCISGESKISYTNSFKTSYHVVIYPDDSRYQPIKTALLNYVGVKFSKAVSIVPIRFGTSFIADVNFAYSEDNVITGLLENGLRIASSSQYTSAISGNCTLTMLTESTPTDGYPVLQTGGSIPSEYMLVFSDKGSGEVWEEIDYSNPPSDWAEGDRFKLLVGLYHNTASSALNFWRRNIIEGEIIGHSFDVTDSGMIPSIYTSNNGYFYPMKASASLDQLNNDKMITVWCSALTISSGGSISGTKGISQNISISNFPNYTETGMGTGTQYLRMWRLKK